MNAILDEQFPSLDSIAALLESDAGNASSREADLKAKRAKRDEEYAAICDHLVAEQLSVVEAALNHQNDDDNTRLTEIDDLDDAAEIQNIKNLEAERWLTERALETTKQLADPQQHSTELRNALIQLTEQPVTETQKCLCESIIYSIRTSWYDSELESRTRDLKEVMAKANWPKESPPTDNSDISKALSRVLELELPGSLTAFHVLAAPIAERIVFNFRQSTDTARADKPEWLFTYYFRVFEPRAQWINTVLRKFVDSPMDKFLLALKPTLQKTCASTYSIDSHFVTELLQFASDLSTRFSCSPEATQDLVHSIIDDDTLWEYIQSERQSYEKSLAVVLNSGSQAIDFDADVLGAKPTFIALNVRQLIQESEYLLDLNAALTIQEIQLRILHKFIAWLQEQVELYDRTHSSLARAVSSNKESMPKDVSDIQYLGRILGSASYMRAFLEVWSAKIKVVQSGVSLTEELEQLNALRLKASSEMTLSLTREAQKSLKAYFRYDWRYTASHTDDSTSTSLIKSSIESLTPSIDFVNRLCPRKSADHAHVFAPLADSLGNIIWRLVIQANMFSQEAAAQLYSDLEMFWSALELPFVRTARRNIEAAQLLQGGEPLPESILTSEEVEDLLRRRVL